MPGIDSFPSFRKERYAKPQPESINDPSEFNGPEEGEIIKLHTSPKNKYRADIRLLSGPVLSKVRLAGPFYGKLGYQHGHKTGYKTGQRVKVTYLENRRDCYTASAVYPLPAGEKEGKNLDKNTDYDPEEVSTGHESGHKTVWKDGKIVFQDKLKKIYISIDYNTDEITLQTKTANLTLKTDSLKGTVTKSKIELTESKTELAQGDSVITLENSQITIKAKKITVTDGMQEYDLLTHTHISGAPGTPTAKPTKGS